MRILQKVTLLLLIVVFCMYYYLGYGSVSIASPILFFICIVIILSYLIYLISSQHVHLCDQRGAVVQWLARSLSTRPNPGSIPGLGGRVAQSEFRKILRFRVQSFQVEGPRNREISLFIRNTIERLFTITFHG